MPEIFFHKNVDSFWDHSKDYCNKNYYACQPLLNIIERYNAGREDAKISEAFNIQGSDVFGLWANQALMLYGSQVNEEVVEALASGIGADKIGYASVTGQRQLVLALIEKINCKKNSCERTEYL